MDHMDKSLERDILSSLGKVVDLVRSGTDQVAALTKVASERGYSVPVIHRMCEAYNKSKSVYYLSKTASDKRGENFDLVDPSSVVGNIFNKTAAFKNPLELPDFSRSDLIAFERKSYIQKTAELLWDNADKGLDEDPGILANRAHKAKVMREQLLKKANDEGRVLKLQVETLVDDLIERAQRLSGSEFNKVASRLHTKYGQKGDNLIMILEAKLGREAELEKEARAVILDNTEPYLTAVKTMGALSEYHSFLKQAESAGITTTPETSTGDVKKKNVADQGGAVSQEVMFGPGASRENYLKDPSAYQQTVENGKTIVSAKDPASQMMGQTFPFKPMSDSPQANQAQAQMRPAVGQPPPTGIGATTVGSKGSNSYGDKNKIPGIETAARSAIPKGNNNKVTLGISSGLDKTAGIDMLDAVTLPVLAETMAPGRGGDLADMLAKPEGAVAKGETVLSAPVVNSLDNLKTQNAFYDMIADDDFLSKQPIDEVLKAYKKVVRIAPSLRDNPDIAANLVARAIETGGRMDPAEISNLYMMEAQKARAKSMQHSDLLSKQELTSVASPYERAPIGSPSKGEKLTIFSDLAKASEGLRGKGGKSDSDKPERTERPQQTSSSIRELLGRSSAEQRRELRTLGLANPDATSDAYRDAMALPTPEEQERALDALDHSLSANGNSIRDVRQYFGGR